jgi:protein TonB
MFPFASERGRRPAFADLPPTLLPCAVAASAPPADHLRAATFSLLVYLTLAAGMVALSSLSPSPPLTSVPPPGPGPTVVYESQSRLRVMIPAAGGPQARGGGVESAQPVPPAAAPQIPSEAPAGLPTENHALDPVVSGRSGSGAPSVQGEGPGQVQAGSTVQDFTSLGLAVLRRVDPAYPEFARRARIQGPVVLLLTVDERGHPTQVQVLQGHPVFHEVALQAARQWRFEPARMDGRTVAASFRLTLNFSLR